MKCVLHGSFRQHWKEILQTAKIFQQAQIDIAAPALTEIKRFENGFALFEGQENLDPRFIELQYLHQVKGLGKHGFSYFVNPGGYLGRSASYELGMAQAMNVPCYFWQAPQDHPAYLPANSIWSPENLAQYVLDNQILPSCGAQNVDWHRLWEDLIVPGSVVATGGIIEHQETKDILLVKTHKWGGRFSIVGGKVRRNERLDAALIREVKEETGLDAKIGEHLCTFDQIKNSGYYQLGVQHVYVDNVAKVGSKEVQLNEEAQDYIWIPADIALRDLDVEPNARHTLEIYVRDYLASTP